MSLVERWVIPGVVAVGLTAAISLWSETGKIETDLAERSQMRLHELKNDWAGIAFSGRDGVLTGTAPKEGAASTTIAELEKVWGVRVVSDSTKLLAEQKPFTWGLDRAGNKVAMIGYLPYDLTKTAPKDVAAQLDGLELNPNIAAARGGPDAIDKVVAFSADMIAKLPNGKAMLIDNMLTISGALEDGNKDHVALYADLKSKIAGAALGNVELDFQIAEPKKPEPPKVVEAPAPASSDTTVPMVKIDGFSIARSADGVALNGVVPSDKVKQSVLQLAYRKFGFSAVSDGLSVQEGETIAGLAAKDYTSVTAAILQAVSRLGEGKASLTADGLNLSGGAFYEGALAKLQESLKAALPASLAFSSDLSVTAPGEAVDAAQCQTLLHTALSANTILFDSGKATISADSFGLLDGLLYTAHRCTESRIQIEGHTDSDGDDALNQALSEKRAASVVTYLVEAGLAQNRLDAKGFGETKPVADNGTKEGKAKNRRIEFTILTQ